MSYVHSSEEHMRIGFETDGRHIHLMRLNNILCQMWPLTPHGSGGAPVPLCANGDVVLGSDIDARMFYYQDQRTEQKSHQYWIVDDGRVVCDTDELMDLKSPNHMMAIIYTIIKDIYGDYELEPVFNAWMKVKGIRD